MGNFWRSIRWKFVATWLSSLGFHFTFSVFFFSLNRWSCGSQCATLDDAFVVYDIPCEFITNECWLSLAFSFPRGTISLLSFVSRAWFNFEYFSKLHEPYLRKKNAIYKDQQTQTKRFKNCSDLKRKLSLHSFHGISKWKLNSLTFVVSLKLKS